MKRAISINQTKITFAGTPANAIECGGELWIPDAATAYMELYMAHSFPAFLDVAAPGERPAFTTLHPAVLARSFRSLRGKPVNLGHLMKSYDPDNILRDRILGTVMAVEFPAPAGAITCTCGRQFDFWLQAEAGGRSAGGRKCPGCEVLYQPPQWRVQGARENLPCIRAVAALHKNAEGVAQVLETWGEGRNLFTDDQWAVSMENEADLKLGGFLVKCTTRTAKLLANCVMGTPPDFAALEWIYVPYASAPADLLACLREGDYVGLKQDYCNAPTLFLNGGLDGQLFFFGVAIVPQGQESGARIARMCAGLERPADLGAAFDAIGEFVKNISPARPE